LADKRNVTALMTAESIIVGFLLAYAPVVNERVVSLRDTGKPVFTTVLAGLLVYGLVLIAFRSLLLLFESIRTDDLYEKNYNAGYDLFLMVILGSGLYALMNALSVVHYAMTGSNVSAPGEPLSTSEPLFIGTAVFFFVAWVLLVLLVPLPLTQYAQRIRSKYRARLLGGFAVLVIVDIILEAIIWIQVVTPGKSSFLLEWPWHLLPSTVLALTIVAGWMLVIPESCYVGLESAGSADEDD